MKHFNQPKHVPLKDIEQIITILKSSEALNIACNQSDMIEKNFVHCHPLKVPL